MSAVETPRQRLARQATLATWLALLVVLALETVLLANLPVKALLFVILLKTAPLLLALPAFRQPKALTPVWLSLLLLPYLCWAIVGLWVPGAEGIAALVRTLLLSVCITATIVWGWRVKSAPDA